jgi:hypothetical protein
MMVPPANHPHLQNINNTVLERQPEQPQPGSYQARMRECTDQLRALGQTNAAQHVAYCLQNTAATLGALNGFARATGQVSYQQAAFAHANAAGVREKPAVPSSLQRQQALAQQQEQDRRQLQQMAANGIVEDPSHSQLVSQVFTQLFPHAAPSAPKDEKELEQEKERLEDLRIRQLVQAVYDGPWDGEPPSPRPAALNAQAKAPPSPVTWRELLTSDVRKEAECTVWVEIPNVDGKPDVWDRIPEEGLGTQNWVRSSSFQSA